MSAAETVKRWLRAWATPIIWSDGNATKIIREQSEASKALAELPPLPAKAHPYYPSVDDGQCGTVIAAHLTDEQMEAVPLHIAVEVLDDIETNSGVRDWGADPERRREHVLSAYGPDLAELVCQAIDDALASPSTGYKRLKDYDGEKFGPLDSDDIDEPYFEDCAPDAAHASPVTSFDFWGAIEAARQLVEERDQAAAKVRNGQLKAAA